MNSSLHTIRKQTLQFQYNGDADGFALQKEVSDWCNFTLIPEIEQQLDLLNLGENYFTIDKLEIEATTDKNNWQQKIRDELIFSLKQKLNYCKPKFSENDGDKSKSKKHQEEDIIKSVNKARKLDELILYYFANGYLPWWGKSLITADFEAVLQNWIREELSQSRDDSIREKLKQLISKNLIAKEVASGESVSKAGKLDELILYFFENGYLPWWRKALIADDFETVLQYWIREEMPQLRADSIREKLKQTASKNQNERILNLIPQEFFFQLLKNIYKPEIVIISHIETFLNEVIENNISAAKQRVIKKAIYGFILTMIIENEGIINTGLVLQFIYKEVKKMKGSEKMLNPTFLKIHGEKNPVKNAWQQHLINVKKDKNLPGSRDALHKPIATDLKPTENRNEEQNTLKNEQNTEEPEITEIFKKEKLLQYNKLIDQLTNPVFANKNKDDLVAELEEGIYVDNAGAVIFAAFIPALFKKLALEENGVILNPDLAALIIQYCVTGDVKIAEYELVLPKILCGIAIEFPVNTNTVIATDQMKEVDEMLLSLIEYWLVLKNTSIEGLRESFFKRSGKLSMVNNEWLLQVEQKPFDMLLQQLPWSISMIKLPWMTNLLKTEWT
jgi:hypothetical protein